MSDNNMASLVGGAALGAPFQMLFDVVDKVPFEKALLFKTMLNKIKSRVTTMEPLIKELTVSNMALDLPQSEMKGFLILLKEGKELVDKCSRFSKWQYIHKRPGYATKLQKLDESLTHLLATLIPLQTARNQAETLGLVRDLLAKINGKTEMTNYLAYKIEAGDSQIEAENIQIEVEGQDKVPPIPPVFTIGIEAEDSQIEVSDIQIEAAGQDNNMVSLIGGSALGPPFQMLFDVVVKIPLEKALLFKTMLNKIKSTVTNMEPLIKELTVSNMVLDRPQSEMEGFVSLLKDGKELVDKCSKNDKWWNFHKKPGYTTKLQKLDEALMCLLAILPPLQAARNQAETLILVRELHANGNGRAQMTSYLADKIEAEDSQIEAENIQFEVESQDKVPPIPPVFTIGLDAPLKDLKMKLINENTSVLVLTASPGCGKTTLAKMLCWDDQIKEKFKSNIMFVKVSKTPSLNLIVQDLYQWNGREMPFHQGEEGAEILLKRLLRQIGQSPMLLVLDDVWSESVSLVEKFCIDIPDYKILVTSRFSLPRFGDPYNLELLNHENAMTLFRHYAFTEKGSSNFITDRLVKKVVERCKKVPLALISIGSTLRNKPRQIWEREVKKWSKGASIFNTESELLACLQSSIDILDKKDPILKECFMDLGLFPEDRRIPTTAFIDLWTELYEIEDDDGFAYLIDLSYHNLLNLVVTRKELGEEDDYYSEFFVTQHDMLRELAIHQSSQNTEGQRKRLIVDLTGGNFPNWWKKLNEQPFDARVVSISTDGLFSSKWCNMQLPEAEVLVLNFQTKNHALPEFVKTSQKLKVMIITNYDFFPAELSNFQLLSSLTNLKIIRFERIVIPPLGHIKLENLHKLSFVMCKIDQAFGSVKISDAFPNLVEINFEYCKDLEELPNGLCEIVQLKKLRVIYCNKLSTLTEEMGNLVNIEVLRFRSCRDLTSLPDSICKLLKLESLDISDCPNIPDLPENIGELRSLTKLNIKNCSKLQDLPGSICDLKQLEYLRCDKEMKEQWEPYFARSTNIKFMFD